MSTVKCQNAECPNLDKQQNLMRCGRCREATYCSKTCQTGHWKVHKKACTIGQPFVLLLSLSDRELFANVHENIISALQAKVRIVQASSTQTALQYLADTSLRGVFVTDNGIVRKSSKVLAKLIEWVKAGGIAVVGGLFSSFTTGNEFDGFFEKWGLPWRRGDYHRTTFVLNSSSLHQLSNPSTALPTSYSMKAVHVEGIKAEEAVYAPTDDSRIQSHVFAPTKVTNLSAAPVVYTQIGSGFLGYIGDVNAEEETTSVILAMLRL